ncbi:MAG: 50S ribosomal protein L25/general stress protein Ctc [Actinomycetaceae bacterium]|nr:50S ribosomal protein L25/general stress protein Ctc [Actinomycetaceae bacterium]
MPDITKIAASVRKEFGKGAARRARRAGLVPAVVYSADIEPMHLDLPGHEVFLAVKGNTNALLTLVVDGEDQLALVKDIQRHPVRRDILHVDLLAVKRGEKVEVEVPLVLVGESAAGTVVNQESFTVLVSAPAIAIPENLELSIEGLEEGTVVTIAQLSLPEDVTCDLDPETVLASVVVPEEIPEPVEGEDAEGSEAGEGEAAEAGEAGEGEGAEAAE